MYCVYMYCVLQIWIQLFVSNHLQWALIKTLENPMLLLICYY